ncbi:Elongin-C [Beauveria bassiana]|nr:Elongin-C [Beauveria bassiana]
MATTQTSSKYVTLVSGDGFEFVVLREATMVSPIIKGMLEPRSQFAEAIDARCVFQEMSFPLGSLGRGANLVHPNSALVLDKIVEYFHYWYQNRNSQDVPDMEISPEICLEVLAAADYLGLDQ